MLQLTRIYKDNEDLKNFINLNVPKGNCIVKIFTSNMGKSQAFSLAKYVNKLLPDAKVVGASSALAVIMNGEIYENETLIVIEVYDKLKFNILELSFADKDPLELSFIVHEHFKSASKTSLVHILFSDWYEYPYEFIDSINNLSPTVKLCGGIAGSVGDELGYVFTENGIVEHGFIAFCAAGTENNFIHTSSSAEIISEKHVITKMSGYIIDEIDDEPALDFILNFLEIHDSIVLAEDFKERVEKDYLIAFPILLEDKICRFTQFLTDTQKLAFYKSNLYSGTEIRIGYVNSDKLISEAYRLCENILNTPVESIFTYVCMFRKLQNNSTLEMLPFHKQNVCGIFMMGEITFDDGKNEFHNGAFILTGIAENNNYLIPDASVLENITTLNNDINFLKKATEKGKLYLKAKNKNIAPTTPDFIDENLNLPNLYKFKMDKKSKNFTKICLVENITADSTISSVGTENFYISTRELFANLKAIVAGYSMDNIHFYAFNYKSYIFAASDEISDEYFIEYMRELHEHFEHTITGETGIPIVTRFAVSIDNNNLLDVALRSLKKNSDTQDNFFICENHEDSKPSDNEAITIDLLNKAISGNKIIPYYQGIYDNDAKAITKYESLMRIEDENGKIYTPYFFMETAKKYKFYNKISIMMLDRVFSDFENTEQSFSVNVSLYDLQSDYFRKWIIERISNFSNASNVVIEFVETENIQNLDLLFEFISEIRNVGAKIAVDDFGAGYSTFSTIVALKPDFIKIDGSIVGKIEGNSNNLIILKSICHLASQIETKTIAEFVENSEIQHIIDDLGVNFSQGYHFSKPQPFKELNIKQ